MTTVSMARARVDGSIRIMRTMERLRCTDQALEAMAHILAADIDDLVTAAKREVVRVEQAGLALAATIADGAA